VPTAVPVGILVLIVLGNSFILPGWWAGTRSLFQGSHRERTLLASFLVIVSLLAVMAVAALSDRGVIGEILTSILTATFLGIFALLAIGIVTIYWLNQPKFLVPPRLRRQPGRLHRNRRR
jgi:hypothetical protein